MISVRKLSLCRYSIPT